MKIEVNQNYEYLVIGEPPLKGYTAISTLNFSVFVTVVSDIKEVKAMMQDS